MKTQGLILKPVEQALKGILRLEYFIPLTRILVGRDHNAGLRLGGKHVDNLEEDLCLCRVEGVVTNLVDYQTDVVGQVLQKLRCCSKPQSRCNLVLEFVTLDEVLTSGRSGSF